jgi:hypothetical protein
MEYLLAGNLLSNPGKVMACICNFTAKVVDKLWQGTIEHLVLLGWRKRYRTANDGQS